MNSSSWSGRPDSPLVDPEMLDAVTGQVLDETLLVNMYRSGRAVGVDPENGSTVWERQLEYPYAGPAGMNEEHVVYASTGGGRTPAPGLQSTDSLPSGASFNELPHSG